MLKAKRHFRFDKGNWIQEKNIADRIVSPKLWYRWTLLKRESTF